MNTRWSTRSVVLHWASAGMIGAMAVAGFVMADLAVDAPLRLLLSRLHTAGGMVLMVATLARLLVRFQGPAPQPLPMDALHRRGVSVVHGLLYASIFALGASGFITGIQSTWPSYLQGQLAGAPSFEHVASREVHETIVFVLLGLTVIHVAGVVIHQVRHGGAVRRMVPFLK